MSNNWGAVQVDNDYESELIKIDKRLQQLITKQSMLLDMYNDGDFTKDEWRAQNELIRNENQSLSNRKIELLVLINKENIKDTNCLNFEKEIISYIRLNTKNEEILKPILHKQIKK
ncbi:hypothetical protein [Bacillus sp. EAC]|uniref:hypothetical protein n=1 Tax=Bacillus sp. EAC TaxID=1978338 RepID=UPI000B432EA3|nr:hypothetical protein [Bacillus sp. EAC]